MNRKKFVYRLTVMVSLGGGDYAARPYGLFESETKAATAGNRVIAALFGYYLDDGHYLSIKPEEVK